jgi:hypothetical protein
MGLLQNIDTDPPASLAWEAFTEMIANFKRQIQGYQATFNSDQLAGSILSMTTTLASYRTRISAYVATPGLSEVAQSALNDPTANTVVYVQSLQSAIDAVLAWVSGALPSSGGYNLILTLNANGTFTWRTFTTAQLAGLRTQLTALLAAV